MTTVLKSYDNISLSGNLQIRALEIHYKGALEVQNNNSNLIIADKFNKILVLNISQFNMPEKIFNYNGNFEIIKAKAYTGRSFTHCKIETEKLSYGDKPSTWNEETAFFGESVVRYTESQLTDIGSRGVPKQTRVESVIKKEMLRGSFKLKDGSDYEGDVIYHSNHKFFTSEYKELIPVRTKFRVRLNKKRKN